MMSKLRELESILESVRSETVNYFGAIQTLQQGSNSMAERIQGQGIGLQNFQREILVLQDEVPRLRSRVQASEEATG